MNLLLKLLLQFLGQQAKLKAIRETKRRSVVFYLKAINGVRLSLAGLLMMFLSLQLMIMAFAGAVVTGFMLWDYDFETKIQILFGVCATLFLLPLIALCILLSQRVWFKASGAQKMIDEMASQAD